MTIDLREGHAVMVGAVKIIYVKKQTCNRVSIGVECDRDIPILRGELVEDHPCKPQPDHA